MSDYPFLERAMRKTTISAICRPPPAGWSAAFARPKLMAAVCVVALAGLGWLYLGVLVAGMGGS